jgi:hypothetical protein
MLFRNRLDSDVGVNPEEISMPVGGLRLTGRVSDVGAPQAIAVPVGGVRYTGRAPTDVIPDDGEVLFANSFESPNDGGTGVYGWDGRYANSSLWSTTHLPRVGMTGTGPSRSRLTQVKSSSSLGGSPRRWATSSVWAIASSCASG